jgi:hypothetical protein
MTSTRTLRDSRAARPAFSRNGEQCADTDHSFVVETFDQRQQWQTQQLSHRLRAPSVPEIRSRLRMLPSRMATRPTRTPMVSMRHSCLSQTMSLTRGSHIFGRRRRHRASTAFSSCAQDQETKEASVRETLCRRPACLASLLEIDDAPRPTMLQYFYSSYRLSHHHLNRRCSQVLEKGGRWYRIRQGIQGT